MTFKKPFLFSSIYLLIFFGIFTLLVHVNLLSSLDLSITVFLQKVISRKFDTFFSLFSLFGSAEMVLVIILLMWAIFKKLNYFSILLYFGVFHVIEFLGKFFVNHPSPPIKFLRYDIPFSFPSSQVSTGSSFPSGHVGRTFFISVILFYAISKSSLPKNQKQLFFRLIILFDIIMFISRIYLGEHWFSDVLGGFILGTALSIIALAF